MQNTGLNKASKEKYGDYQTNYSKKTFQYSDDPLGEKTKKANHTNVSWNNLKRVRYRFKEEREISDLIGIDV